MLQREALRKQKDDLRQENQQLRRLLRQHLDANAIGPLPPSVAPPVGAGRQHALTRQATPTARLLHQHVKNEPRQILHDPNTSDQLP